MVRDEQLLPAGHFLHAEEPPVLNSSALQATQAVGELDPGFGLAVPAPHAVIPLAPPGQLYRNRKSSSYLKNHHHSSASLFLLVQILDCR